VTDRQRRIARPHRGRLGLVIARFNKRNADGECRDAKAASDADTAAATPNWFADFLIDRATRKPSEHTLKAYHQDFTAVADLLTSGDPADVALTDITKDNMRAAFDAYASTHEPASIRRCWSTWNVLCDFLYTNEMIPANPMPFVGRPKPAKTLPRSLPQPAVAALLDVVDRDHQSTRRTDWPERDLARDSSQLGSGSWSFSRIEQVTRIDLSITVLHSLFRAGRLPYVALSLDYVGPQQNSHADNFVLMVSAPSVPGLVGSFQMNVTTNGPRCRPPLGLREQLRPRSALRARRAPRASRARSPPGAGPYRGKDMGVARNIWSPLSVLK
jgi:hypothetical protein